MKPARSTARIAGSLLVILLLIAGIGSVRLACAETSSQRDPVLFLAEQKPGSSDVHEEFGIPDDGDARDDYLIRRPQYIVSYNPFTHNPNWVSYNLSAWWYGDVPRHKGQFMPDPKLSEAVFRTMHKDYTGSGYDRGHMCRSEERTRTDEDNLSTFYMTNVIPQTHELNAGPWLRLERYCQSLCVNFNKELFVVAGPVYAFNPSGIGRDVKVPSACFKIIVILEKGQSLASVSFSTRIIAVTMPNSTTVADDAWEKYRCTVDDIERATGYDFLRAVPDALEYALESRIDALIR